MKIKLTIYYKFKHFNTIILHWSEDQMKSNKNTFLIGTLVW